MAISSAAYTLWVSSVPMYSFLVVSSEGEYIAAPICPLWPEPSVYIIRSRFVCCLSRCLWACAASFLLSGDIAVVAFSFHHGGRIYAVMCSVFVCMYLG